MIPAGQLFRISKGLLAPLIILVWFTLATNLAFGEARLDSSFGNEGVVRGDVNSVGPGVGVAEDRKGRLITIGSRSSGGICANSATTRFLETGELDSGFGDGGFLIGRKNCETGSLVMGNPDGGFTAVSQTYSSTRGDAIADSYATRYKANGQPFGLWGDKKTPGREMVGGFIPEGLAMDARGRTLVSGFSWSQAHGDVAYLVRLNSRGERDLGFVGDRRTRSPVRGQIQIRPAHEGTDARFSEVRTLGSGRILVSGSLGGRLIVARLMNDGGLDRSFGDQGIFSIDLNKRDNCGCTRGISMVRDHENRILLAGFAGPGVAGKRPRTFRTFLVRLRPNGRLDKSFGTGGIVNPGIARSFSNPLVVQDDGRIVLGGGRQIVRLMPSGRIDKSFFDQGFLEPPEVLSIFDLIIDSEKRVVATAENESGRMTLLRILPG